MNILVLGVGRVGRVIAEDLSRHPDYIVHVADIFQSNLDSVRLPPSSQKYCCDLSNDQSLIGSFDLYINALPGDIGYETLKTLVQMGKRVVDISFFAQDADPLHEIAKETRASVVYDCGVAPGMSNMIAGRFQEEFDSMESLEIYVGGLPKVRTWPFEYKAVFSPSDVIEEYIRPARIVVNGALHIREALSDVELMNFSGVGTLEAFNTDGLRSLVHTISAQNMKEKTLRYPGHVEKMLFLREIGFFSQEEVAIPSNGCTLSPLSFTNEMFRSHWELGKDELDLTVMQVKASGLLNGKATEIVYNLYDERDLSSGYTSMSRTTGFTATAMVHYMIEKSWRVPGVHPPELMGASQECFEYVLRYLSERGVEYRRTDKVLSSSPLH
ncbi:MAG: saccharopine dehydrogenase NADP-binding domain-containing protein [Bdellovibrionales bacterium]|nr:saccharopine dehydrogenase NADP-binding domain-containing protein [Bdellovibrionales bacterium]